MIRATVPTPGTNKLTERLLVQGVKLEDYLTWPEGVWACEANNFAYSRMYRFTPTWESPCGLLIHEHGDMWGETWAEGEFKCAENDNPLFGCPCPGKPCEHRKKLPAGINCQFHRTDREWNEAESVERLAKLRSARAREIWETDYQKYPGWKGYCPNVDAEDMPDGSVRRRARYTLYKCLQYGCQSTQCICRMGAERDLRKANIFYDLYIEKRYNEGLAPYAEKKLRKGLKVFDKPVAWTDAEIALKIWKHDPDSWHLPGIMHGKLSVRQVTETKDSYFVRHHRWMDGRTGVELYTEIRNIRIGRNEQRDMMQDLQDARDGIEVVHASDQVKAAKALKNERRQKYKVEKAAKLYALAVEDGTVEKSGIAWELNHGKPEFRAAVLAEAGKIVEKRREQRAKADAKSAQVSMFDLEVEG